MKKEQVSKITICLYIVIALLIVNTICHIVELSKLSNNQNNSTNSAENKSDGTSYDVSMFTALSPAEITKKIKSGDEFVLFLGQEKCTYCQKILPVLQQAQKDYKYTTVYLNVASSTVTSSTDYAEMAALLDKEMTANGETKEFGKFKVTPMVAIIRNGKMVDGMIGYNTYDNFAKFLESAGINKN